MSEENLVGKFFHSTKKNSQDVQIVVWQGKVNLHIMDDVYLVEVYDWMTGSNATQFLLTLNEMRNMRFEFYDEVEEMRDTYEYKYSRRGE